MTRAPLLALALLAAASVPAFGHPLNPALLELRAHPGGAVDVRWRVPALEPVNAPIRPVLPRSCRAISAPRSSSTQAGQSVTTSWRVDCGAAGLTGQRVGVEGLHQRGTDALLRIDLGHGRSVQTVLRDGAPSFTVPARAHLAGVLQVYLAFGFRHILDGVDHLLFVLGLVLLVRSRRQLLWTITSFTLGHSVTLSLAALGLIHISSRPVEVLIALSIFLVAVELVKPARARTFGSKPWTIAFGFGLLHGLGFASALMQAGLPGGEIPAALFSFNVGIELGQLVFVAAVLVARRLYDALPLPHSAALRWIPAYTIGALSFFWVLQRL